MAQEVRARSTSHSERARFVSFFNERTERETSECLLKLLGMAADFDSAIRRFDPSRPSQPVWHEQRCPAEGEKGPQTAGFRARAPSLYLPIWAFWVAKSSKVSAQMREYSRFEETMVGDLVRSPLEGEVGSQLHSLIRCFEENSGISFMRSLHVKGHRT